MPRLWPLLAVHFPASADQDGVRDRVLAIVDDYQPTAIADEEPVWRIYFDVAPPRDQAAAALEAALGPLGLRIEPREESDEDWARRSQEGLGPVHVGRFLILGHRTPDVGRPERNSDDGHPEPTSDIGHRTPDITIAIQPSTGFGTGHHASTRLCLRLLQRIDATGASVLDVGCGSGILAIAAARLGAAQAVGIDIDPDAVDAARRNLALNPEAERVTFLVADITGTSPSALSASPREPSAPPRELALSSLLFGNLTGTFLTRHAEALLPWLQPGGWCILSGILAEEEALVRRAFTTLSVVDAAYEDEWVGLLLRRG
jgi:ribosomal protein L11 methyltransferase